MFGTKSDEAGNEGFIQLTAIVVAWLYFALFECSKFQATPGKLALGIKVTDLAGNKIGFGRATGRYFARILSSFLFGAGYIAAGLTKRKQGFHDMAANTLVVKKATTPEYIAAAGLQPAETSTIVILVVVAFGSVVLIGILAAIAIPAYQNYIIRSQITEGLMLADPYKTAVGEAIFGGQQPSSITTDTLAGKFQSSGKYVEQIGVMSGAIVIKFGRAANAKITGEYLVVYPAINDENHDIVWICGTARVPSGVTSTIANADRYTDVPAQFLPSSCHR
jgi:Tfp pilus assembly major pilin PilA